MVKKISRGCAPYPPLLLLHPSLDEHPRRPGAPAEAQTPEVTSPPSRVCAVHTGVPLVCGLGTLVWRQEIAKFEFVWAHPHKTHWCTPLTMSSQNYRVYLHFFSPKDSLIKRRGRGGAGDFRDRARDFARSNHSSRRLVLPISRPTTVIITPRRYPESHGSSRTAHGAAHGTSRRTAPTMLMADLDREIRFPLA